jgi:hypothetical protein
MINEDAATAIDPSDVTQAAILKQPLALDACDRPTPVETGANGYIDGNGVSRLRDHHRRGHTDHKAKDHH